jgi:hypothetical protein
MNDLAIRTDPAAPAARRPNPVSSAPCSFGVDEVIDDDAWMPDPEEMLDWMADLD